MMNDVIDIENVSQDELFEIFESIPSDNESIANDEDFLEDKGFINVLKYNFNILIIFNLLKFAHKI